MQNEYHIETTPILPDWDENDKSSFPEPHEKYISAAHKIITEMTLGIECYLWVDYLYLTSEFIINPSKCKNISLQLRINIEDEIKGAINALKNL